MQYQYMGPGKGRWVASGHPVRLNNFHNDRMPETYRYEGVVSGRQVRPALLSFSSAALPHAFRVRVSVVSSLLAEGFCPVEGQSAEHRIREVLCQQFLIKFPAEYHSPEACVFLCCPR